MALQKVLAPDRIKELTNLEVYRWSQDGAETTVYLARYELASISPSLHYLKPAQSLLAWAQEVGARDACSAGYFSRPWGPALGEVWIDGLQLSQQNIGSRWGEKRGSVLFEDGHVMIAPRAELPTRPSGSLVQAGPMLIQRGRLSIGLEGEGFKDTQDQFDVYINSRREPHAALGVTDKDELLVVHCDGRITNSESGMYIEELAQLMLEFGAVEAINLDGGSSSNMLCQGQLVNLPAQHQDLLLPGGRVTSTVFVFAPAYRHLEHTSQELEL